MTKSEFLQVMIGLILAGLMIFVFILMVGELMIDKMKEVPQIYCEDSGGKWLFYECYSNGFYDCSKFMHGYYCVYSDGRAINESEIWKKINWTT